MNTTLRTEGITKVWGTFKANSDVSLSFAPGARHALIGPNGAGKTTFINLLTGALAPTAPPSGLERLASLWSAPIPDYAPSFMHSESFGYIMSALIGAGLIILTFLLISWLLNLRATQRSSPPKVGAA